MYKLLVIYPMLCLCLEFLPGMSVRVKFGNLVWLRVTEENRSLIILVLFHLEPRWQD
jgi:hypothetical protein